MTELSDELLGAYMDGALSPDERNAVERALVASRDARARLEALRAADQTMQQAHPAPATRLDDPIARKIRDARLRSRLPIRLPAVATLSALAAGLVGLIIGQAIPTHAPGNGGATFAAAGALAQALETQPSGEAAGDVRVLLSFKTADATACRQFSSTAISQHGDGVACRDADAWRVVAWVETPVTSEGAYRAAGADSAIDAVIDRIDATGALSVDDERALRDARWR